MRGLRRFKLQPRAEASEQPIGRCFAPVRAFKSRGEYSHQERSSSAPQALQRRLCCLEDIKAFNENLFLCCLLTYGCLLRPHQEIRQLTWSDFSDDLEFISLSGKRNKSGRNRIVPISRTSANTFTPADVLTIFLQALRSRITPVISKRCGVATSSNRSS